MMAWIKALVVGMGVLLAAGLIIIVVTLVTRTSTKDTGTVASAPSQAELGPGERLVTSSLDGTKMLYHIETPSGSRVEVRRLKDGALIKQFDFVKPTK
jgi:hypothetical protein